MGEGMSEVKTDLYKNTLNLPQTDFPMKANLPEREPIVLKNWDEIQLYHSLLKANQHKPKFVLLDGPPYANGQIHIGHAINKILKDMVVKSKLLSGFNAPYIPGWDCHGLPIEHNVEKKIGKPGSKGDLKTFRKKCREYAQEQLNLQREAFIRLGVLGDWNNPYTTMDYQYEADIIRSLAKIIENGHVQKGYKPVHWCIDCASALAEAEVEYRNKTSSAIDVCFEVVEPTKLPFSHSKFEDGAKVCVVIWTTTPWTLPANQAVAIHPEHDYALVHLPEQNTYIIVVAELMETVLQRFKIDKYQVVSKKPGKSLEGILLKHPFYDRKVPVVLGEHVTLDAGTGCVHTAPAHGVEDFEVGQKYHLPLDNPVDGRGIYVEGTPLLAGEFVLKANDKIIQLLKENHALLHEEKTEHSYPHCWRHHSPLIFRATQQWFISMEAKHLREKTLTAIKKVKWVPDWGQGRIEAMIKNRPDWCISRQRTWGTPLCLLLHKKTGDLHPNTVAIMEKVAEQVETQGIDAWYDIPLESLIGNEAKDYEKSLDTIDVWFDSGVAHACLASERKELNFPAQLYLEGSDQHRGWFQSSLLTAMGIEEQAPYQQVLTHGFAVDASGHKMSKSLGNTIAPEKVIQAKGADVLRLWVAATDYRSEMAVSDEILTRVSESYRRIRNTARFLLANLHDFNPEEHAVPYEQLLALDRYLIEKAIQLQNEIKVAYDEYQFHTIYQKLHSFCSIELGSFYLDIIKDRQYTGKTNGIPRRSAQTALYHIAEALVRWMAPILSFTAEEIWRYLPGKRENSVFKTEWYNHFPKVTLKDSLENIEWGAIISIRNAVNKALEEARNAGAIGSGLEAKVSLYANEWAAHLLRQLKDELRFVFITSEASVHDISERTDTASLAKCQATDVRIDEIYIEIQKSEHEKCQRCWHRRADVNANKDFPGLCSRCVENVSGEGEIRKYA